MADRDNVQVFNDAGAVAAALADVFVEVCNLSMADRGCFRVALSGGNTPRAAYELLAAEPRCDAMSWSDVFVYFGDERCVPPDDELSNYRMAEKAFLGAVPIPAKNVHRIRGEIDPGHAANEYASVLREDLASPPHFDLVLLGLGPDGHTASLFPGSNPDKDDSAWVRAVYADAQAMWRVTITPKLINSARNVVFAVEGDEKAAILRIVLDGPKDPVKYPAQIVDPKGGRLIWLVDEAAAAGLGETKGE